MSTGHVQKTVRRIDLRVQDHIEAGDLDEAVQVLRESMRAVTTVRSRDGDGKIQYVDRPDYATRTAAACRLIEFGSGKATTRMETRHEVAGGENAVNPADLRVLLQGDPILTQRIMSDYLATLESAAPLTAERPAEEQPKRSGSDCVSKG